MRSARRLSVLLLGVAFAFAAPAGGAPASLPGPIQAEVIEVLDGDTLAVRAAIWLGQSVETNVRIDGIDTPELRGRCQREKDLAEAALRHLRALVAAGRVHLFDVQHDKYGNRVRARVRTLEGADVGRSLIDSGLARPYAGDRRQPWCELG